MVLRRNRLMRGGVLALTCCASSEAFYAPVGTNAVGARHADSVRRSRGELQAVASPPKLDTAPAATEVDRPIILSTTERAKTVTHIATCGTLCTFATGQDEELSGTPFGSHVDYVLDARGWPVFLLAEASLHTQNIRSDARSSLLCRMPRADPSQPAAALSRVTLVGEVVDVTDDDELIQLKANFPLVHKYADQLLQSPTFKFYKLRPKKVYYVGGFGVLSKWLAVEEYELAKPDVLAADGSRIVSKLNQNKKEDLFTLCRQFLGVTQIDEVSAMTVDRLGIDIRVTSGKSTDEVRVGFRQPVASVEDAKSEIVKVFQEAWEKEQGFEWEDQGPPTQRYAQDILQMK